LGQSLDEVAALLSNMKEEAFNRVIGDGEEDNEAEFGHRMDKPP